MTCVSPFVYMATYTYSPYSYQMKFTGSTTIKGYTTPSVELCFPCLECDKKKCGPGCICNTWQWCKCCTQVCVPGGGWSWKWCDCSQIPGIEIFPTITLSGSISTIIVFNLVGGTVISPQIPLAPIECSQITISQLMFDFTVSNGSITESFSLSIPLSITIMQINGQFAALIPLTAISTIYNSDGVSYTITFGFNLLACLTPKSPVGWLNLQVVGKFEIEGVSQSFLLLLPILSSEEEE